MECSTKKIGNNFGSNLEFYLRGIGRNESIKWPNTNYNINITQLTYTPLEFKVRIFGTTKEKRKQCSAVSRKREIILDREVLGRNESIKPPNTNYNISITQLTYTPLEFKVWIFGTSKEKTKTMECNIKKTGNKNGIKSLTLNGFNTHNKHSSEFWIHTTPIWAHYTKKIIQFIQLIPRGLSMKCNPMTSEEQVKNKWRTSEEQDRLNNLKLQIQMVSVLVAISVSLLPPPPLGFNDQQHNHNAWERTGYLSL